MRLLGAVAVLVGLAAPAMAQSQGSFAIDAMTTPGRHVGFGYYFTDGLSLRPSLGAGYAEGYGMTFNLGTELRWETRSAHRVSYCSSRCRTSWSRPERPGRPHWSTLSSIQMLVLV